MSNQEDNILQAVDDIRNRRYKSIRQCVAYYGVPRSTVASQLRGRKSKTEIDHKSQRFTVQEQKSIIQWINDLQRQHRSLNHAELRGLLENLLQKKGDFRPLGEHYITRFIRHHSELKSGFSRAMDVKRMTALDPDIVETFFAEFERLKTTYGVEMNDIYNMDETGFQMGQNHSECVIFNSSQGPPLCSTSDNTSWVSIIECISPSRAIQPYMIFQGRMPETGWFPSTWELPQFLYAFSDKGWTDDELAVDWLERIFVPKTQNDRKHRILIVDGHRSHTTGKFQYLCFKNNIHLLFLPSHSSHKLRPLDMGPFSPLSRAYSKAVKKYTPTGVATFNRRIFIKVYAQIRPESLSERAIRAGWKRTGLWPLDKQRILDDPDIKNFGRTTPEYQPLRQSTSSLGLYSTPKKFEDYRALKEELELNSTPCTRRKIEKLGNAAL